MNKVIQLPDRFIVIDDDTINNTICELALKKVFKDIDVKLFDLPVLAFKEIAEEYSLSASAIPTVLFLDINMPEMTGWAFLDKFKELDSRVRNQFTIFILSSSIDHRDREKAGFNPLVSGFIEKPLSSGRLKELFPDQ